MYKEKLVLVDYAIASDGGSITLIFNERNSSEIHLRLDRNILSETKERIYLDSEEGSTLLSFAEEKKFLETLERSSVSIEGDDGTGRKFLSEFISIIRKRESA